MKSSNLSTDYFKKLKLSGPIPEPTIQSGDDGQRRQENMIINA